MHWRCFFVWCDCVFFRCVLFRCALRLLSSTADASFQYFFFCYFIPSFEVRVISFLIFFRFLIYFGTHSQIEWDGRFSDSINSIRLLRTCVCWRRLSYAWEKKTWTKRIIKQNFDSLFGRSVCGLVSFFLFLSLMHLSFPSSAANKILYAETQETDSKNDEHYNTRDEIAL